MDNSQNNTLIENPTTNNSSSIDEFIFNISGIKEEYFNNFFKDIVSQNWGIKMEDVVSNDNLKVYMGFFTDEINEIIDQYDNILIQNTIDIDNENLLQNNNSLEPEDNNLNYDEEDDNYYLKFKNLKQINSIFGKSKKLSKDDALVKEKEKCHICFEEFKPKQLKRKLTCNHFYHQKCIDKWLKINARCPICRAKFL